MQPPDVDKGRAAVDIPGSQEHSRAIQARVNDLFLQCRKRNLSHHTCIRDDAD